MVEFGAMKHREGIISLWISAFGDSREEIENFLDNMLKENIILITDEDKVIAMASVLPVSMGDKKGRYVYAVATDESCRGKGFGKAIMEEVERIIKERDEHFAVLVPASESLFEFYKKLGYSHTVFAPKINGETKMGEEISLKEYISIQKEVLKDFDYIKWSDEDLNYILSFGKLRKINGGAVYIQNGKIVEALSEEILEGESKIPFALIKYINCEEFKKPYFGLAMN